MPLILKQVRAIIDARTTVICLQMHGVAVPVTSNFETVAGDFQHPPFHVHCRSLVSPVIPGYVSQARKEANAELQRRPKKARKRGPGGELGSTIPKPTTKNPPSGFSFAEIQKAGTGAFDRRVRVPGQDTDPWRPTAQDVGDIEFGGLTDKDASEVVARSAVLPDEDARAALEVYTSEKYEIINHQLRNDELTEENRLVVANVMRALDEQHPLDEAVVTYRGMSGDFLPDGPLLGKMLKDPALLSTTMKRYKATLFTQEAKYAGKVPVMLEIMLPAGTKALAANVAEGWTEAAKLMKYEAEIVLPPNTELMFLSELEDAFHTEGAGARREFKRVRAVIVPKEQA